MMEETRHVEKWNIPTANLAYKVWKLLGGTSSTANGNSKDRVTMAYMIAKAVKNK